MSSNTPSSSPGDNSDQAPIEEFDAFWQEISSSKKPAVMHHRLRERVRVRLGGFTAEGEPIPRESDVKLLGDIEAPFVEWIEELKAVSKSTEPRDEEGFTPRMRELMILFSEHGGHISHYTEEQRNYLMTHGLVAFVELFIRDKLYVTVGAITGLSRNPWTDSSEADGVPRSPDGYHKVFPQFDLRGVSVPPDRVGALQAIAQQSFLTCRSSILPSLESPVVRDQMHGEELPDELKGMQLQRAGLAAWAKSVNFGVAEKFGNKSATSNISSFFWGTHGAHGWENIPSRGFNHWMSPQGLRNFRMEIDPVSKLDVGLYAHIGSLKKGQNALIGSNGIATRKGHDIARIHKTVETYHAALLRTIASGDHAPW